MKAPVHPAGGLFRRAPAVAGTFYPSEEGPLRRWITFPQVEKPTPVLGVLSPHAGYIYSGELARKVFAPVEVPDTALILTPNHTGLGERISLHPEGIWEFPGFEVRISPTLNSLLRQALEAIIPHFRPDPLAHAREHSGEVIVPFLYGKNPQLKIAVLTLKHLTLDLLERLASALSGALRSYQAEYGSVLIVASSDMTHYLPAHKAFALDALTFPALENLDGKALYQTVEENDLTMCGYIPTALTLMVLKELGAHRGVLVGHTHSGVVTGDDRSVVSYAGYWFQ